MRGRQIISQSRSLEFERPPDVLLYQAQNLETITDGDAVYVNASGRIGRARANASSTMPAIGVALEGGASGQQTRVLTRGVKHSPNYNFSGFIGQQQYVSRATAGAIATGDATTSGDLRQVIGYAVDGSGLYVAPLIAGSGRANLA